MDKYSYLLIFYFLYTPLFTTIIANYKNIVVYIKKNNYLCTYF